MNGFLGHVTEHAYYAHEKSITTACKYRGKLIGWLYTGPDGLLKYNTDQQCIDRAERRIAAYKASRPDLFRKPTVRERLTADNIKAKAK